jgi:hypothetical protein
MMRSRCDSTNSMPFGAASSTSAASMHMKSAPAKPTPWRYRRGAGRYGLARKPLIFAHNANSVDVAAGIKEMYPGANVLHVDNLAPAEIDIDATPHRQR